MDNLKEKLWERLKEFIEHDTFDTHKEEARMHMSFEQLKDILAEEVLQKLAEYKDAEEQGLLIRLPVAEGTHVYCIGGCGEICDDYETDCEVCGEHKVVFCTNFDRNLVEHFGETVFLTEAEAEQALAKMEGE